jgi:hypothetical protein
MAHPVCSLCSHPRRADIDAGLLGGLSTAAVAKNTAASRPRSPGTGAIT